MKWLAFISAFVLCWGCRDESSRPLPDVSEIEIDFKVVRFDRLLSNLDTLDVSSGIDVMLDSLPAFTHLYFQEILGLEGSENLKSQVFHEQVSAFLQDERINYLLDTVSDIFGENPDFFHKEYEKAFKYLTYRLPDFQPPNIYTIISEYAYQQFLFEDENGEGIGVGLDLFLGENFPYMRLAPGNPAFSAYLTRTFNKDHIVRKSMELILDEIIGPPPGSRFIDFMLHNGKMLYILENALPETHDSILLEYSGIQTQWVHENQVEMWAYFINEGIFYETDIIKINKYLQPSPHSPGMPKEAPGRTANFLGWQIVKTYMDRHPQLSMSDLISEKDSQKLLEDSRYKPRRKK